MSEHEIRWKEIGKRWELDSRLEKWFPFTAEELTQLRARVKELEEESKRGMAWADRVEKLRLKTANNLTKSIENNNEQEVTIELLRLTVNQLQARIRELEEAMPTADRIGIMAGQFSYFGDMKTAGECIKMAEKIDKVIKK